VLFSHQFNFCRPLTVGSMGNSDSRSSSAGDATAGDAPASDALADTAPPAALVFGLGGLIPFIGLATLALFGSPAFRADAMLTLANYSATIVSFVGALHWGYAVRDDARGANAWARCGCPDG
jgi:Protein of unknown function (DUF3429)